MLSVVPEFIRTDYCGSVKENTFAKGMMSGLHLLLRLYKSRLEGAGPKGVRLHQAERFE